MERIETQTTMNHKENKLTLFPTCYHEQNRNGQIFAPSEQNIVRQVWAIKKQF